MCAHAPQNYVCTIIQKALSIYVYAAYLRAGLAPGRVLCEFQGNDLSLSGSLSLSLSLCLTLSPSLKHNTGLAPALQV